MSVSSSMHAKIQKSVLQWYLTILPQHRLWSGPDLKSEIIQAWNDMTSNNYPPILLSPLSRSHLIDMPNGWPFCLFCVYMIHLHDNKQYNNTVSFWCQNMLSHPPGAKTCSCVLWGTCATCLWNQHLHSLHLVLGMFYSIFRTGTWMFLLSRHLTLHSPSLVAELQPSFQKPSQP
jgi:hypothetical protein